MSIQRKVRCLISKLLTRQGFKLVPQNMVYDWQIDDHVESAFSVYELEQPIRDYLSVNNPRLKELQDRYDSFDKRATTPLTWSKGYVTPEDIQFFRGDNAYVWQLRGKNMNNMSYALSTYYTKSIDTLGMYERLKEDKDFGNFLFSIDHRDISRDLIDSIIEISFLEKHLGISTIENLKVLDIGSGYGRQAHRMVSSLDNLEGYYCTDGVAVSSFICEYYLKHRKVDHKASIIPLDEIPTSTDIEDIDLAINIHSFSECQLDAIDWWISQVKAKRIKHVFIIPNAIEEVGNKLLTNDGKDFTYILEKYGYELIVKEPKYRDPAVQQYGMNPTFHYLFKLKA